MARTNLTPVAMPTAYATGGAAVTWTAGDLVNGNQFKSTGSEILLVRNVDGAAPHTVTVTSANDPFGRTGNASRSIPANGFAVFQKLPTVGWQQPDGYVYLTVDNVNLQLAVLQLPC